MIIFEPLIVLTVISLISLIYMNMVLSNKVHTLTKEKNKLNDLVHYTNKDLIKLEQRELDAEYEMVEYLEYHGNFKQCEDAEHQKKYLDEKQIKLNQRMEN